MPTFTQITGATGLDPKVPTAPITDGSIRGSFYLLVQAAIALAATFGLDLNAQQVGATLVFTTAALVFLGGVFDRYLAKRIANGG